MTRLVVILSCLMLALPALGQEAQPAAQSPAPAPAPPLPPPEIVENSIGIKLAKITPGEFTMGSTHELGRYGNEEAHKVRIAKPYLMGVYEVTQQEYQTVMGANPSAFSPAGAGKAAIEGLDANRLPVESVTWDEANEFCRKLSELEAEKAAGRAYRLPTEAEWEYACRAGTTTPFHFGEGLTSQQANFDGNYPYLPMDLVVKGADPTPFKGPYLKRPAPVGSYPANAFGLHDMHGNVWEWCADRFSPTYYTSLTKDNKDAVVEDPAGPETGTHRVARGAGWYYFGAACRSAARYERDPAQRRDTDGFRVVCLVAAPPDAGK